MADAEAALALHSPAGALAATFAALAGEGGTHDGQGEVVVARRQLGTVCRRHGLSVIDVAATAHARLCEVGSVDRLTIDDYSHPRAERVAMMLWVEGADYEIVGAGERQPSREDLAAIARRLGAPLVVFLPTAALCPIAGLDASIPRVGQAIASGADLVVLSGERYLGGPACGIIVGRRRWVEAIAAAPLAKLLMADRLTLAALEATLLAARDRSAGEREIPLWQMLAASLDVLKSRAQRLAPQIADCPRVAGVEIAAGFAYLGPGKLARERVDDWRILVEPSGGGAEDLAGAIRAASPSVWSTLAGGRLCLSMRSMLARDDERLVAAFAQLGTRRAKGPSGSAKGPSDRKTKVAPAGARPASGAAGSSSLGGGSEAPGSVSPEEAKATAAQAERFAEE
jgi:L-seryl-tRNA(Ser) seleniumtransferase